MDRNAEIKFTASLLGKLWQHSPHLTLGQFLGIVLNLDVDLDKVSDDTILLKLIGEMSKHGRRKGDS